MTKRVRDEDDVQNIYDQNPPLKCIRPMSSCRYCNKQFTTRGMTNHLNKCKAQPRHYNFYILNDSIFECILNFLNNQTLCKLQMITGDKYSNCEPRLAAYCCKCENDNLAIFHELCRECELERESYSTHVTLRDAGEKYGGWNLSGIPCEERTTNGRTENWYDRTSLEKHMIQKYGSKLQWVRGFVRIDTRMKKLRATLKRKKEELDAFFETLAPGFAYYLKAVNFRRTDKMMLEQCNRRFVALTEVLTERGLEHWWDSRVCKNFIITGDGDIEDVADTVELEELE